MINKQTYAIRMTDRDIPSPVNFNNVSWWICMQPFLFQYDVAEYAMGVWQVNVTANPSVHRIFKVAENLKLGWYWSIYGAIKQYQGYMATMAKIVYRYSCLL
jgi:hypothetical protein